MASEAKEKEKKRNFLKMIYFTIFKIRVFFLSNQKWFRHSDHTTDLNLLHTLYFLYKENQKAGFFFKAFEYQVRFL